MNKYLRNYFVGIKKGLPHLNHRLLKNFKVAQKKNSTVPFTYSLDIIRLSINVRV